ncbi:PREDICTED: deleted in azoospermia-like [Pygoscelis adeliae]|uniref:deleted in azoospermia-like n=1 Tax=Pygoscelis adeliae TaxID=9238 RepID=UPI0004F4FE65|nr:PREDICTED: deleted in azoospermia-like [Pygoscelis adeliae]
MLHLTACMSDACEMLEEEEMDVPSPVILLLHTQGTELIYVCTRDEFTWDRGYSGDKESTQPLSDMQLKECSCVGAASASVNDGEWRRRDERGAVVGTVGSGVKGCSSTLSRGAAFCWGPWWLARVLPRGAESANVEAQCAGVLEDNTRLSTTSQGYVLPEGKIMPNTVFVGGIDIRMNEAEIRSFFERYGTVKEVKIITDRTGVSKGYGFVSFLDNVDVQKIVESQINFHGKKLKLGPAIRKQQNLCSYVHPRPLVFNPPAPQFHSVWGNQNTETYMQPPAVMSPVTQYVQTYPYSSPALLIQQQVPVGYQPAYNYQVQPQWLAGEQRNYVMPPVYTSVSYHCTEDPEFIQTECAVPEPTQSSANSPQKKSVDRSIQTVVSCLFNPENRLRNTFVSQEDYFKERKAHHFRKGRAVLKSV